MRTNIEMLSFEQDKAINNLQEAEQIKIRIELIGIVEKLGYVESEKMKEVRNQFTAEEPTDINQIQKLVKTYLDQGQMIADKDSTSKGRLAFNILLILLYSVRQTDEVDEAFNNAIDDAILQAENEFPHIAEKLEDLFPVS
jgi:hypothetical protein